MMILSRSQRVDIRNATGTGFDDMMNLGYYPMFAGPENLVWDNRTKTLYWIGFRDCELSDPNARWSDARLPHYYLVKLPKGGKGGGLGIGNLTLRNGNTEWCSWLRFMVTVVQCFVGIR